MASGVRIFRNEMLRGALRVRSCPLRRLARPLLLGGSRVVECFPGVGLRALPPGKGERMRSQLSAVGPLTSRVLQSRSQRPRIRGGLPAWRARRVTAYIDTRLAGRVSVAELARLTGLSTGHFSRAFKQSFGVSARTFLRRRRIEFAQVLMLSTDFPLNEIAHCCGLCHQPHLSKMFRSVVGENPSAWRRARCDT